MSNSFARVLRKLRRFGSAKRETALMANRDEMLLFYSQFIKEGDLCFDAGANLGSRTDVFLRLGAKVVAMEPQSSCARDLRRKYQDGDAVVIIQAALGSRDGEAQMYISNALTITSLSKDWIDSVQRSGRFSDYRWDKTAMVRVITLDSLIEEYGKPVFCKIDVEGYEFEVLKGLSQPIRTISFEFTPEYLTPALDSIEYLSGMSEARFNYSLGESMCLALSDWVGPDALCRTLVSLPDKTVFGDVYASLIDWSTAGCATEALPPCAPCWSPSAL